MDTSAIMGFMNSILDLIKREKPENLAVAFDLGGSVDRIEIFKEYKANRHETPDPIKVAVPYIHNILDAMGIPILMKSGYEADDIIGTIAKQAEKNNYEVFMVTPDKDFAQLVKENVFLYKPAFMGRGVDILGVDEVLNKFKIKRIDQVIDFLGLQGDSVDNIPGIPGVGPKTAQKLLSEYDSVEGIIENRNNIKGSIGLKIQENYKSALMSKELAVIKTDVSLGVSLSDLKGKVVLLNFWGTWCGPCKREIPDFVSLSKKHKKNGLEIIGVTLSSGPPKKIQDYSEKWNINYTLLTDINGNETQSVTARYGQATSQPITGIPTTFIIDRDGYIRQRYVGPRSEEDFYKDF